MFGPLSLFCVLILFFGLSSRIYQNQQHLSQAPPHRFRICSYVIWLLQRSRAGIQGLVSRSEGRLITTWRRLPLPGFDKGLLGYLVLSFLYLALSGLISVWWPGHNLHGLWLVLHMVFGGLFAAVMTTGLLCWARFFIIRESTVERPSGERFLFWLFSWSGLLLILSALGMMLPIFTAFDQPVLLTLHRYAALIAVLSGVVLAYRLILGADNDGT